MILITISFQPLDQGIIHCLKANYRKLLITKIISELEIGNEFKPSDIDLLMAMNYIKESLNKITSQTIMNCFKKAKFDFTTEVSTTAEGSTTASVPTTQITVANDESESDDNFWERLRELTNLEFETFDEYVTFDDNEEIGFENSLSDEQIIEVVNRNDAAELVDLSDDEESDQPVVTHFTNSQAFKAIETIQGYLCQIGETDLLDNLSQINNCIVNNSFKSLKQTKISDYCIANDN